jgi:hypothetical protein
MKTVDILGPLASQPVVLGNDIGPFRDPRPRELGNGASQLSIGMLAFSVRIAEFQTSMGKRVTDDNDEEDRQQCQGC